MGEGSRITRDSFGTNGGKKHTRMHAHRNAGTHTHKSCIMIFTCATLLRLLGGKKNLLDHAGMFSFKLMVKKKDREKEGGWG